MLKSLASSHSSQAECVCPYHLRACPCCFSDHSLRIFLWFTHCFKDVIAKSVCCMFGICGLSITGVSTLVDAVRAEILCTGPSSHFMDCLLSREEIVSRHGSATLFLVVAGTTIFVNWHFWYNNGRGINCRTCLLTESWDDLFFSLLVIL